MRADELRYVASPDEWSCNVLADAMDELRRGRSPVASVTAARLKRHEADVLLQYVEDLKDDVERLLASSGVGGGR